MKSGTAFFLFLIFISQIIVNSSTKGEFDKSKRMSNPYAFDEYRPHYHFSPPSNWINDPNGLVYDPDKQVYHMYYQYNPWSIDCDHKNWGHAISKDLLTWEVQTENNGVALAEDLGNKTEIFSGSAVSFKNWEGKRQFVGIYTTHHTKTGVEEQSIAFSTSENANTLQKFSKKDPVIPPIPGIADFRDPFVTFYRNNGTEPSANIWLMVVALPFKHFLRFYTSKDLINWNHLEQIDFGNVGEVNGIWECPSMQSLKVKNSKLKKTFLLVSFGQIESRGDGVQYFIGDFDLKTGFKTDKVQNQKTQLIDYGYDFYATTMWNFDSPDLFAEERDKIVTITWMNNWYYAISKKFPTKNFRGMGMTIPRNLYLVQNSKEKILPKFKNEELAEFELISDPIQEVANNLRVNDTSIKINNLLLKSKDFFPVDALKKSLIKSKRRLDIEINYELKNFEKTLEFGLEIFANQKRTEKSVIGIKMLQNSNSEIYFDRSMGGKADFDESFAKFSKSVAPISLPLKEKTQKINIQLRILTDVSSVEIFEYLYVDNSEFPVQCRTLTNLVFPEDPQSLEMNLFANNHDDESVLVKELKIFELKPTIPM